MIRILAGSPYAARRIAAAVGGKAKIVEDADDFTNVDGHVECLILGCRHPIPAETKTGTSAPTSSAPVRSSTYARSPHRV